MALPAFADEVWQGSSVITFSGTSTLHDWEGKVSAKSFETRVSEDASGKPTRIQAEVVVDATQMDTAEPKRDENMRKAMKVTDYPLIRGSINAPVNAVAADGVTPTKLPLKLTLLGKTQDVEGTVTNWKRTNDKASFDLDFELSMKESGISVPSVLFFIRVGDAVKVHATVTLLQK